MQPHDAESEQASDHAGENQHERQIRTLANQDGTQHIVECTQYDSPHEKCRAPRIRVGPIQPDHRRKQHEHRTDLRDAEQKRDTRQQSCKRDTCQRKTKPGQDGLHQRSHHHAERNRANGLTCE